MIIYIMLHMSEKDIVYLQDKEFYKNFRTIEH